MRKMLWTVGVAVIVLICASGVGCIKKEHVVIHEGVLQSVTQETENVNYYRVVFADGTTFVRVRLFWENPLYIGKYYYIHKSGEDSVVYWLSQKRPAEGELYDW